MTTSLSHYLDTIRARIRLDSTEETEVIHELETHIEDRLQELTESGLSEEEAVEKCAGLLGSAKLVAHQIYEAHSQGTWKQSLLAAMPHLLFGLMFALNWWQHPSWLLTMVLVVILTSIYGCWHGKPTWVFPWLGYSLVPVMVIGVLFLYLPKDWSFILLPLYFPLALWWLSYIIVQSTKRDWLCSSLTLLPIPIVIGWFLTVAPEGRFTGYALQRLYYFAPWIGLSFLALALTIATFIRVRQRWLRIGLLIVSGLSTFALLAYYAKERLSLSTLLGLILVLWGIFLVPPLLERWVKSKKIPKSYLRTINHHAGEVSDATGSHSN